MTNTGTASRESSFDGEVEESRKEIEDQEDESEKTVQVPQSGSRLSSPSESQQDNAMKDLIKNIFPTFEFSSSTNAASRHITLARTRPDPDNAKILEQIRNSWESSDMKYRYDRSIEKLTSR